MRRLRSQSVWVLAIAAMSACGGPESAPGSAPGESPQAAPAAQVPAAVSAPHAAVSAPHAAVSAPHAAVSAPHAAVSAPHAAVSAPHAGVVQDDRAGEPGVVSASLAKGNVVEVVQERGDLPEGSDAVPRLTLAFRLSDGRRVPIEGEAVSYAPFRDGVAIVDTDRRLVLVSPSGARRVLARRAGAPPVRGPRGELVYVAKYRSGAEVHVLEAQGVDRVVAKELGNAGLLAPQPDGRLFFVAARNGGVAGLWIAEAERPDSGRCLTNCALRTGKPWGEGFVPPPGDAASIRVVGDTVEWKTPEGIRRFVSLPARNRAASGSRDADCAGSSVECGASDLDDETEPLTSVGGTR